MYMPSKKIPSSEFGATVVVVPGSGDALAGELDPAALLTSGTAAGSVLPLLNELSRVRIPALDGRRQEDSLLKVAIVLTNPNADATRAGLEQEVAAATCIGVRVPEGLRPRRGGDSSSSSAGSSNADSDSAGRNDSVLSALAGGQAAEWEGLTAGAVVRSPERGAGVAARGAAGIHEGEAFQYADGSGLWQGRKQADDTAPAHRESPEGEWGGDGSAGMRGQKQDLPRGGAGSSSVAAADALGDWGRQLSSASNASSWSQDGRRIPGGLLHLADVPMLRVRAQGCSRAGQGAQAAGGPGGGAASQSPKPSVRDARPSSALLDPLDGMELVEGATGRVLAVGGGSIGDTLRDASDGVAVNLNDALSNAMDIQGDGELWTGGEEKEKEAGDATVESSGGAGSALASGLLEGLRAPDEAGADGSGADGATADPVAP